jgi:hypothetical protein
MSNGPAEPVFTVRDMIVELKTQVEGMRADLAAFKLQSAITTAALEDKFVLQAEYDAIEANRKTMKKYLITTIVSIIGVATALWVAVINVYPTP